MDKNLLTYYLEEFPKAINIAGNVGTIHEAAPTFAIDGTLDQLSLGARATLAVQATPPQTLDGALCTWTFEPADVLRMSGTDGACRVEVAMPVVPFLNRGGSIPIVAFVRITKAGALIDEVNIRASLHNRLRIDTLTSAATISPEAPLRVTLVRQGTPDPLPAGFTCAWNLGSTPLLRFKPSNASGCDGSLEYKPESEWKGQDGIGYAIRVRMEEIQDASVQLLYKGAAVHGSEATVKFKPVDSRDLEMIQERFEALYSAELSGRSVPDLPPVHEYNEKTVALSLMRERGRWQLVTRYVGSQRRGQARGRRS